MLDSSPTLTVAEIFLLGKLCNVNCLPFHRYLLLFPCILRHCKSWCLQWRTICFHDFGWGIFRTWCLSILDLRPLLPLVWRWSQGWCPSHFHPRSVNRFAVEQTVEVFFPSVELVWCLADNAPSRPRTSYSLLVFVFRLTTHAWFRGFLCHSPSLQSRCLQLLYLLVLFYCPH